MAVRAEIQARQATDRQRLDLDRAAVIAGLLEAIGIARERQEPAAMIRGWAELAKLMGYNQPQRHQVSVTAFGSLIAELNAWLEQKDRDTIQSDDDKKLVARVIAHDASMAANYIPAPNGLIATYAKNMLPALVTVSVAGPTYTNLAESFSFKEWPAVRVDVARVLGIVDKTHSSHGSNFKGSLTLKQVIDNVAATVQGTDQKAKVAALIRKHYPAYR